MTHIRLLAIVLLGFAFQTPSAAAQMSGDELYLITMVRAAPGKWVDLYSLIVEQGPAGTLDANGRHIPYRVRHSQGAQWDFMLIQPMTSLSDYFSGDTQRVEAPFRAELEPLVDFEEHWVVVGPPRTVIAEAYPAAGMFLIEMFRARAGMKDVLFDSRVRENGVLEGIGVPPNFVFAGQFGADWDVMTIGFHESLAVYAAAGNDLPEDEMNSIARRHGFKGMWDLAPSLRALMTQHSDTIGSALP